MTSGELHRLDGGAGGWLSGACADEADMRHDAGRPDWTCLAKGCGKQWPCKVARGQLLMAIDPTDLAEQMAAWLQVAAEDMPDRTPRSLWEQFLGWIRPQGLLSAYPPPPTVRNPPTPPQE